MFFKKQPQDTIRVTSVITKLNGEPWPNCPVRVTILSHTYTSKSQIPHHTEQFFSDPTGLLDFFLIKNSKGLIPSSYRIEVGPESVYPQVDSFECTITDQTPDPVELSALRPPISP